MDRFRHILSGWVSRLWTIRVRLSAPASEPDAWLLRVRERVLRFLVARYAMRARQPEAPRRAARRPPIPPFTVEAADSLPRRRGDLRPLLADVRRINVVKRPRWRWF